MSSRKARETLAACMGIFLVAGMLVTGFWNVPANAAPDYPEFVKTTWITEEADNELVFDEAKEPLTLIQEMDNPANWKVTAAEVRICIPSGAVACDNPDQFRPRPEMLQITKDEVIAAQRRLLTFQGEIPNSVRSFAYYLNIEYDRIGGPGVGRKFYPSYQTGFYQNGQQWWSFDGISGEGDSRITFTAPASIPTGSALTLSGTLDCYSPVGTVGYKAPDYGSVYAQYLLPGQDPSNENNWRYAPGGWDEIDPSNGAWSITVPAWGTTADWRIVSESAYFGDWQNGCDQVTSETKTVVAGTVDPPDEPELPGAPGLVVAGVTSTTATLNWSAASGTGIIGYRFGWTSDSGKPVPSWSKVYSSPPDPFVMTNLNPSSAYTMYVEAVTARGPGARATVRVTTAAPAVPPPPPTTPPPPGPGTPPPPGPGTPPPPPPPPPAEGGVAPSKPRAVKAVAGNRKARLSWKPPAKGGTGGVVAYEVHRYGVPDVRLGAKARTYVWKKLKNNATYSLYVRAVSKAGPGPWVKRTARPSKR